MKIWNLLGEFGISPDNDPVDIPRAVVDLVRASYVERVDAGSQTFSLPGKETSRGHLAPNGLSRWLGGGGFVRGRKPVDAGAFAKPVGLFAARKPFEDYIPSDARMTLMPLMKLKRLRWSLAVLPLLLRLLARRIRVIFLILRGCREGAREVV